VLLVLIGRQTDSRSSARGCTDWKVFTFQGAWHGVPFTYKGGIKIPKTYQFQINIFQSGGERQKMLVHRRFV
jgi:hypothetical protein